MKWQSHRVNVKQLQQQSTKGMQGKKCEEVTTTIDQKIKGKKCEEVTITIDQNM